MNEPPNEMFGKLMSISDEMMARYYALLLGRELPAIMHPLEAKKQLALRNHRDLPHARSRTKDTRRLESAFQRETTSRGRSARVCPRAKLTAMSYRSIVTAAYANSFRNNKIAHRRSSFDQARQRASSMAKKITDPKAAASLASGQVLRLDKTHAVRIAVDSPYRQKSAKR